MLKFELGKYRGVIISIALFLLLDALVLSFNFYISFQMTDDAVGINVAGRQRMLSQQMAKSLYMLDATKDDAIFFKRTLAELQSSQELFDQTLKAFIHGGQVKGVGNGMVDFRPITRQKAKESLQDAAAIWESYQLIKAPRDGIVNNLQAIEGQQAILGRTTPLLTLLPENSELKAQLLVPVRSAGFLAEGQSLTLRYEAFPYQKFGMYKATIEKVSNTILLPNELLNAPLTIQEPVYRITAQLDRITVQAYGKDFPLRPGMTLNADIKLSERSILQWLLEPIYSLQGRL